MPGEYPRCQVGTINPPDMPDGSGQQLRVATIMPRPSRQPPGQLDNPSSESGQASQSSTQPVTHPSTNRARRCLTSK